MKKIPILLAVAIAFNSCSTTLKTLDHIPREEILRGIDFRPYAEMGFLFTPHEYNGEYISISLIDYIILPEGNYIPYQHNEYGSRMAGTDIWVFEKLDVSSAVDSIYNISIDMEADAVMDFSATTYKKTYSGYSNAVEVDGIRITGLAINREEL